MRTFNLFISLLTVVVILSVPYVAAAQSFVTCEGRECGLCHLISTGQNVLNWLVGILTIIAVLMLVYAGFRLVTSAGNPEAKQLAKSIISNILIGYTIVLASWLLVDTGMRVLLNQAVFGSEGTFGPWNRIECVPQPVPGIGTWDIPVEDMSSWCAGPGGSIVHCVTGVEISEEAIRDSARELEDDECPVPESETVRVSAFGSSVRVHPSVAESLQEVSAAWQSRGGNSFYDIRTIGCHNCRRVRGTNRWSAHAFGLACDINQAENGYYRRSTTGGETITDMPPEFRQIFLDRGWGWGGNWRSVTDAMHFSKAAHEGGDGPDIR